MSLRTPHGPRSPRAPTRLDNPRASHGRPSHLRATPVSGRPRNGGGPPGPWAGGDVAWFASSTRSSSCMALRRDGLDDAGEPALAPTAW